jgi:hypothetical protein
MVRIFVAWGAIGESQFTEFNEGLAIVSRRLRVTLAAFDLFMRSGESESRLGVIIVRSVLPAHGIVAGLALGGQLCPVRICVASQAFAREPKESAAGVFWHQALAIGGRDMRGFVALAAGKLSMASGQRVAGSPVVEILLWGIPLNQCKVSAVVFRVAGITPLTTRTDQLGVQAAPGGQALIDLPMAGQAFAVGQLCSDLVTVDAVFRAIERTVRPGQRSGRYLRPERGARQQQTNQSNQSSADLKPALDRKAIRLCVDARFQ